MVEPAIAQALQDIEDSNFLPGFRLNGYVVDSQCTVSGAIVAAVTSQNTAPPKHLIFGDSCSEGCEMVNDAMRFYNVMQVSPGCVSGSLSDAGKFPYFTRMAPSLRFNVQTLFELFKFLGFQRIGVVYGTRSDETFAKTYFLELIANDTASANSWTPLYTHAVESIQDAQSAVEEARRKDARINFMALYESAGAMLLCQCHKQQAVSPDYNWFVALGWWSQNFIIQAADSEHVSCSESELQRAAYGLIAIDRGPMLATSDLHGLSQRPLSELYAEYTTACRSFANGKGVCNHQWAGYFYDGIWLIASILHTYLVEQNRSIADLGTAASRQGLYDLSLSSDFLGQTGRVRQFNSVEPKTSPPSHGDRDGTLLLRQATGPVDQVFVELAFRTEAGFDFKTDIKWSSTDSSKMVSCLGASCDLAGGWLPLDRSASCPAGEVWTNAGCAQCGPGSFATPAMSTCAACGAGSFSNESGASECRSCAAGFFAVQTGAMACTPCGPGSYADQIRSTTCVSCPYGTYGPGTGLQSCTDCPPGRTSGYEGAFALQSCICPADTKLEGEVCLACSSTEVCEGGQVVGVRPSDEQWLLKLEAISLLEAQGEAVSKYFLQIAKGIRVNSSTASFRELLATYSANLDGLIEGKVGNSTFAHSPKVAAALHETEVLWQTLSSLMVDKVDRMLESGFTEVATVQVISDEADLLYEATHRAQAALIGAAEDAGAELNSLLVDIAGRQRILIQRMCKKALLMSHGVSREASAKKLEESSLLYEESKDGLVFGIPAAGVPELEELCTMHQMRDVHFYYEQVRPFIQSILNAETPAESSQIASLVVANITIFIGPLYDAMDEAVHLFAHPTTCNPLASMTSREWWASTVGLVDVRIGLMKALRFFMQIANGLAVDESKVKLTLAMTGKSKQLKDLLTGDKETDVPSPITQELLNKFVIARKDWAELSKGFEEAIQAQQLLEVDVIRSLKFGEHLYHELMAAMDLLVFQAEAAGTTVQTRFLDLVYRQQYRFDQMTVKGLQILLGYQPEDAWLELNATALEFRSTHRQLMVGGLLQGSNITLKPVTDVCIGRMMSNALNLFNDLEQAVRALAAGDKAKVADINLLSPAGQLAMAEPSLALERFYEGQSETCEEFALSVDEWMLLMTETTRLGGLAQSFARAFARWERMQTTAEQESFEAQRGELTSSLERLMLGSDQPPLPVQPSQELFRRMAEVVQPAVAALRGATSLAEAISRMGALEDVTKALLQTYADEVLKQEPSFPAQRVQVAMWQSVLAQTAYKEALLATYKLTGTSDMQSTMNQFETAQIQLKDGGGPVPRAIMLERRDLLTQWEAVQLSWARFKGVLIQGSSQLDMEAALQDLLADLDAAAALFAIPDVRATDTAPWVFAAAYGTTGCLVLACCGAGIMIARAKLRNERASRQAQDPSKV
eukprot:CAMPEP_0181414066 /NCGR_PEP_ID=MMETSP1110-20121109/9307_1 /TAXON_ID=174948 /ORGANISM="Symbiodinium sp., Strain CCMP421" /LENGTH=1428 /DNA_ID=CAMNT_0023536921 /DNA_START=274 /DNA_END=4560 /DNA_ORIENTATION=+